MTAARCPHCDAQLKLKAKIPEGKRIRCPKCQEVFPLSMFSEDDDEPASRPVRRTKGSRDKTSSRGSEKTTPSRGLIAGIAAVIAGVFLVSLVGLWLVLRGPAAEKQTPAAQVAAPAGEAIDPASSPPVAEASPPQAVPTAQPATGPTQVRFNLNFIADDVVAATVVHPKRIWDSATAVRLREVKALNEEDFHDVFHVVSDSTGLKATEIEEIAVLIPSRSVTEIARLRGLGLDVRPKGSPDRVRFDRLRRIGLAMHNHADAYNKFPKAGGPAQETDQIKDGLSWRVHLLPFLERKDLYQKFHLDEPWDSEHNKTLIAEMPDVFADDRVKEPGQTPIHVFTNAGAPYPHSAPFAQNRAPAIHNFVDGTSNVILCISAGADAADVWTKPGGLEIDAKSPLACLGDVRGQEIPVLMADGSCRSLPSTVEPKILPMLVTAGGGEVVDLDAAFVRGPAETVSPVAEMKTTSHAPFQMGAMPPEWAPLFVITASAAIDPPTAPATKILGPVAARQRGKHMYYTRNDAAWAVAFPDDRTLLFGGEARLLEALGNATTPSSARIAAQLQSANQPFDALATADLTPYESLLERAAPQTSIFWPLSNIRSLTVMGSLSGNVGEPLLAVRGTTSSAENSKILANYVTRQWMEQINELFEQLEKLPGDFASRREMRSILYASLEAAKPTTEGESISLTVPIPEGYERLSNWMAKELRNAKTVAQRMDKWERFRKVGVAFHWYHDAYAKFPKAGGPAVTSDKIKDGLSWRVHLLPWLDQAPLYERFHFDEPWDSEHNQSLIPLMPAIFKSEGVTEPGKTSMHVFTGLGALFSGDRAHRMRDIIDGTSSTLMGVQAGADKAEFWTKPGGLDFDPADPFPALGDIGDKFLVLMGDGSVRELSKTLPPEKLRKLIQIADGEFVEGF